LGDISIDPRGRPNFPQRGPLPRLSSHASRLDMRIISHAYPPPPPLTMNDLHKDMAPPHDSPRIPRLLDSDQAAPRSGSPSLTNLNLLINAISASPNTVQNHTHDSAPNAVSAPYANSPATTSHHERPTSDPTTIRTLLSAPHHAHHAVNTDWRAVGPTDHRHNGDHSSAANGSRDGQVRSIQLSRKVSPTRHSRFYHPSLPRLQPASGSSTNLRRSRRARYAGQSATMSSWTMRVS
jgi:hypothetical protein